MAILDELLPASYKGASFLIADASTSGGRKDQRHEFPNSNKQTIEDLGLRPRIYSIVGWITEPNYISKRDALINALEDADKGVLSHPFYGELNDMKARTFTISESMTELGRAEISMLFEISDDIGVPIQTENTLSLINSSNDDVLGAANAEVANGWQTDSSNFSSSQDKLGSLNSAYEDNASVIVQTTDKINEFSAQVSNFSNEINTLVSQPQALADSITNLSQTLNGAYASSDQSLTVWKEFFGFGDDDVESINQTTGLTQRNKNNAVINQSIQITALSYGYLAASGIDFNTVNDLDIVANLLEDQYNKNVTQDSISQELRDAITNMREQTNSFFNLRRVNLDRIITIRTARLPVRVISYQYYGDSSLGEEIANLNVDANVSFIEGEIQVITQ